MRVAASVVSFLLAGAFPAWAQTGPHAASRADFRSDSALVALSVTVEDQGRHYVAGLQPDDFVVYEDGVKQDVQFFESDRVPIDLIVLIDSSSSMKENLPLVHEAARGFLQTLRPGDRGAVVGFARSVRVLQTLTSDQRLLEQAVMSTGASGSTSLNNAVYISLNQFGAAARQDGEVRRQAIVVLSDGTDTSSLLSFDEVLAAARRTGVSIYTVALQTEYDRRMQTEEGPDRDVSESEYAMRTLARETGAKSFFPTSGELKRVYRLIAAELAHQYSIGYVPANARADGRFRRVVVQVVTRPGLRSRTRLGYVAAIRDPSI